MMATGSIRHNCHITMATLKIVTVMGTVVEKGGVRGIDISEVTAAN